MFENKIVFFAGRRVDLLTITSHHGITSEKEERLKNLFPENQERPYKFQNKKVHKISLEYLLSHMAQSLHYFSTYIASN